MSRQARVTATVLVVLLLGACAAGGNDTVQGPDPAGFWLGLWHGIISPITFLVSLFRDDVNIYEVHNNGNWYDAGFMLGVSTIFSGSARSGSTARSRRSRRTTGTADGQA
jgi:hypothetical protein